MPTAQRNPFLNHLKLPPPKLSSENRCLLGPGPIGHPGTLGTQGPTLGSTRAWVPGDDGQGPMGSLGAQGPSGTQGTMSKPRLQHFCSPGPREQGGARGGQKQSGRPRRGQEEPRLPMWSEEGPGGTLGIQGEKALLVLTCSSWRLLGSPGAPWLPLLLASPGLSQPS